MIENRESKSQGKIGSGRQIGHFLVSVQLGHDRSIFRSLTNLTIVNRLCHTLKEVSMDLLPRVNRLPVRFDLVVRHLTGHFYHKNRLAVTRMR